MMPIQVWYLAESIIVASLVDDTAATSSGPTAERGERRRRTRGMRTRSGPRAGGARDRVGRVACHVDDVSGCVHAEQRRVEQHEENGRSE
jgi:hypothetical protein